MWRESALSVLVAALVVFSGCSAFTGGTPTRTTAEPATDDGVGTPTRTTAEPATDDGVGTAARTPDSGPDPGNRSLPPGVSQDGTVNETKLVSAHLAALSESSWELRHREGNVSRHVYYDDGTYLVEGWNGDVMWVDGDLTVTRRAGAVFVAVGPDGVLYHPHSAVRVGTDMRLSGDLRYWTLEWTNTTTDDGTPVYELVVTNSSESATGTLYVDSNGRIHRFVGVAGDNESTATRFTYEYEWGQAVPEPPWVDTAPRGTVSLTDGGRALNATLTGGPAIPAGTELNVSYDDPDRLICPFDAAGGTPDYPALEHSSDTTASFVLEESLEPGESLYVGVRKSNGSVVVSREPLTDADLVDLRIGRTALRGSASIGGRRVNLSFVVGIDLGDRIQCPPRP